MKSNTVSIEEKWNEHDKRKEYYIANYEYPEKARFLLTLLKRKYGFSVIDIIDDIWIVEYVLKYGTEKFTLVWSDDDGFSFFCVSERNENLIFLEQILSKLLVDINNELIGIQPEIEAIPETYLVSVDLISNDNSIRLVFKDMVSVICKEIICKTIITFSYSSVSFSSKRILPLKVKNSLFNKKELLELSGEEAEFDFDVEKLIKCREEEGRYPGYIYLVHVDCDECIYDIVCEEIE